MIKINLLFLIAGMTLLSNAYAMNDTKKDKDCTEEQNRKDAARKFEELFKKIRNPNPEQPRLPENYDHFRNWYKNLPLIDPNGKIFCYMDLGAPYPAQALNEQGKLKSGWQLRVPLTE